jgi:MoaA/NifB/PqqE/SkfB family radical SAM enzyme
VRTLPVLDAADPDVAPLAPISRWAVAAQYLVDLKNVVQAQIAVRYKRVYLPSLFGHYSVNSSCNLRCSYCYVGQPAIFPEGFTQTGLPLERAKRVLRNLRRECVGLRIQGGEPFLYKELPALVRFARRELRYWHLSIITNGLALERNPRKWSGVLEDLDLVTLSIDRTRLTEYPEQMRRLTEFLPRLVELARASGVALNRGINWARNSFPEYPEVENVRWYEEHCDPKLKIKVEPDGGLIYPCENHSYSAGSLETHTIRELWGRELTRYPNESCLGCGKQRFRSQAMKHPVRAPALARTVARAGSQPEPACPDPPRSEASRLA